MRTPRRFLAIYLALGAWFGIVLMKGQVISWFRIYEMFRFESFHMYGVIVSAVLTAMVGLQLIRRANARALTGAEIDVAPKALGGGTRYWAGGTMFGLGWGLVGACPGPIFALVGGGVSVMLVVLVSAMAGTTLYGALRSHLPH